MKMDGNLRLKTLVHILLTVMVLTVITFSGLQTALARQADGPLSINGWFTIIWGDGVGGSTTDGAYIPAHH